jgi:RNA polymerase sigma-70 factor (ECF subfamily)
VEAHADEMTRLCFVICGDVEMARDAVQDAWQQLWVRTPELRDPTRLRSWLLSVAANRARELARRTRRGSVLEQRTASSSASTDPGARIERLDLVRALDRLEPDARELIGLRYLFGMTEIGEHLGLSAEGVRSRLHRLIERLRLEVDR